MARSSEPCCVTASTVITAKVQQCWDVYIDNSLTASWAPAVTHVEFEQLQMKQGDTRKSHVHLDGKTGHTVEQCTLLEPMKQVEFNVLEETFGFSHMLTRYGFNMSFNVDDAGTLVIMETHYTPKKIFSSVMRSAETEQQILSLMTESLESFKRYCEHETA